MSVNTLMGINFKVGSGIKVLLVFVHVAVHINNLTFSFSHSWIEHLFLLHHLALNVFKGEMGSC